MYSLFVLLLLLLAVALAPARDKSEDWLQVRSPHFTVVTNADEKTGRRIADQFERMRAVFHVTFPHMSVDIGSPIVVLAIKGEKDFRDLEPQAYLAKGQVKLAGLFLRAADKNYVLLRADAEGEHPYSIVYHEYTHLLMSKAEEWLPLWLNEGLAEFYQNTDIHDKDLALGQPSRENLQLLRYYPILPLPVLFTVDHKSPYYHEENKGSIFYAESWALTHYLLIKDIKEKTQHLPDYAQLVAQNVDPVVAATRAFGDLKQLQSNLENYIRSGSFTYFKGASPADIGESAFQVQALPMRESDAIRADFLAYNDRVADARPLLDVVLKEDPKNVSAHETMGYIEFRAGHLDAARKWYGEAVKLDSQSYFANYYFAAISMTDVINPGDDASIESSLRAAIKLNPLFAPPYERLAALGAMRHRNLEEARLMSIKAVELEPGNVGYRLTSASVLMHMQRGDDALAVLRAALKVAKTPQQTASVEAFLTQVQNYAIARERTQSTSQMLQAAQSGATLAFAVDDETDSQDEVPLRGPHHFATGVVRSVRCHNSNINLTLVTKTQTINMHSGNFYKIEFSALGFTPTGDINPCQDLEGIPAKVEYVEVPGHPNEAHVVSIEMHR
jgi:tetratricopeptide (TPR) repeat protein